MKSKCHMNKLFGDFFFLAHKYPQMFINKTSNFPKGGDKTYWILD